MYVKYYRHMYAMFRRLVNINTLYPKFFPENLQSTKHLSKIILRIHGDKIKNIIRPNEMECCGNGCVNCVFNNINF